jgi:hypothetical protein
MKTGTRSLLPTLGLAVLLGATACSPTSAQDTTTTTAEVLITTTTSTTGPTTTTTSGGSPTTTTSMPTTTSTTTAPSNPTTTTVTVAVPPDNKPPTVKIISPANLSSHVAEYDASTGRFGAAVSMSAVVSDPNGDAVTVRWFSSDEGFLGSGESIVATLSTGQFDSAQPRITARATDKWGVATETSVQIIVWIPSDT